MTIDVRALASVGVRRTPVAALAIAGLVAGTGVIARAVTSDQAEELLSFVRLSAVVVAAAATTAIDDPSAPLTDTTWRGRRGRSVFVLVPTALVAATVWLVPVVATRWLVTGPALPVRGLFVELAALIVLGWLMTAAIASSRGPRGASLAGAIMLMTAALGTMTVPRTMVWLWRSPGESWAASHLGWTLVLAAGGIALRAIWRDPAG